MSSSFFFFNDTATTEIYTLSLHDALPILVKLQELFGLADTPRINGTPVTFELLSPAGRPVQVTRDLRSFWNGAYQERSEEHTSELQSQSNLVCRLLLEKKTTRRRRAARHT